MDISHDEWAMEENARRDVRAAQRARRPHTFIEEDGFPGSTRCEICREQKDHSVHTLGITPTTFAAAMSLLMGKGEEKFVLGGVDISRFVRNVQINADPGELLSVQVHLMAQDRDGHVTGAEIPEQLASVVVIDTEEMLTMRNILHDILILLGSMEETDAIRLLIERIRPFIDGPAESETLAAYRKRMHYRG